MALFGLPVHTPQDLERTRGGPGVSWRCDVPRGRSARRVVVRGCLMSRRAPELARRCVVGLVVGAADDGAASVSDGVAGA